MPRHIFGQITIAVGKTHATLVLAVAKVSAGRQAGVKASPLAPAQGAACPVKGKFHTEQLQGRGVCVCVCELWGTVATGAG